MITFHVREPDYIKTAYLILMILFASILGYNSFFKGADPSHQRYMEQCLKDGQPEYLCASILRGFK